MEKLGARGKPVEYLQTVDMGEQSITVQHSPILHLYPSHPSQ